MVRILWLLWEYLVKCTVDGPYIKNNENNENNIRYHNDEGITSWNTGNTSIVWAATICSATISQQRWAGWNLGVKVNCCHFHISSYWDRICSQPMNPQGRITQIFVAMGVAASKSACGAGLWVDLRNHIWVKKSCVIPTSWTEKYLVPKANQAELHHAVKLKLIIIMLAGFQGCL